MLTFNRLPFHHFIQQVSEIQYPGRASIKLLRYQCPLQNGGMTSKHLIKIIVGKCPFSKIRSHKLHVYKLEYVQLSNVILI